MVDAKYSEKLYFYLWFFRDFSNQAFIMIIIVNSFLNIPTDNLPFDRSRRQNISAARKGERRHLVVLWRNFNVPF